MEEENYIKYSTNKMCFIKPAWAKKVKLSWPISPCNNSKAFVLCLIMQWKLIKKCTVMHTRTHFLSFWQKIFGLLNFTLLPHLGVTSFILPNSWMLFQTQWIAAINTDPHLTSETMQRDKSSWIYSFRVWVSRLFVGLGNSQHDHCIPQSSGWELSVCWKLYVW